MGGWGVSILEINSVGGRTGINSQTSDKENRVRDKIVSAIFVRIEPGPATSGGTCWRIEILGSDKQKAGFGGFTHERKKERRRKECDGRVVIIYSN